MEKNINKKMGRPLKCGEPKNTSLHLRITEKESERISNCAEKLLCTKTEAIMQGIKMLEKSLMDEAEV